MLLLSKLQVPLLPPDPVLHVHCWSRLLLDLPSVSSLLLLPLHSRSPLPFLTTAAAPLLDPYARSPAAALQEPEPRGWKQKWVVSLPWSSSSSSSLSSLPCSLILLILVVASRTPRVFQAPGRLGDALKTMPRMFSLPSNTDTYYQKKTNNTMF